MAQKIRIPNNWQPRDYQMSMWEHLEKGGKRALAVWHRRAGKDDVCLHWAATQAFQRIGNYWHMLPEAQQARKAIWDAVNPHTGMKRIDEAFPRQVRKRTLDNSMFIEFVNGSTWQVVGSDNFNSLVGSPPVGVVFSEWAVANPLAWAYLQPALTENGGWAFFISTPRGHNHLSDFYYGYLDDEDWYVEVLRADQTGVFSQQELDSIRKDYCKIYGSSIGNNLFRQEYLCSFDAGVVGAYYADHIEEAEHEGRVTNIPVDKEAHVHTAWDLGQDDQTVIWFWQEVGREIRFIDCYAVAGEYRLSHFADVLKEKGYTYGQHFFPHDIKATMIGMENTRSDTLIGLGIYPTEVVQPGTHKAYSVEDRIAATRRLLARCYIDKERCKDGINALRQYRKIWDEKRKVFQDRPYHDWTSDYADAFGYAALSVSQTAAPSQSPRKRVKTQWIV